MQWNIGQSITIFLTNNTVHPAFRYVLIHRIARMRTPSAWGAPIPAGTAIALVEYGNEVVTL
jgi:hypothetical protein